MALGAAVLDSSVYSYFKHQMHHAAATVLTLHPQIAGEFAAQFGRRYAAVEEFMLDDADYVFIMTNSFASMGKAEIKRLRSAGKKVGLGAPAHDPAISPWRIAAHFARPQRRRGGRSKYFRRQGRHSFQRNRQRALRPQRSAGGFAFFHRRSGRPPFRPGEFDMMLANLEQPVESAIEMAQPQLLFTGEECREVGRFFDIAGRTDED